MTQRVGISLVPFDYVPLSCYVDGMSYNHTPARFQQMKYVDRSSPKAAMLSDWEQAGVDVERARQGVARAGIADCTLDSIRDAVLDAHHAGLDPWGIGGEAWITSRNEKTKDGGYRKVASLTIGYKGVLALCRESGIKRVEARAVFEGDAFTVEYGTEPKVTHRPSFTDQDPNKLTHVYATAMHDGLVSFDVMSRFEVDFIAARSKSKTREGKAYGPWVTDYVEMAKKTVVRRMTKLLPMSPRAAKALEFDDDLGFRSEARARETRFAPPIDEAGDKLASNIGWVPAASTTGDLNG